ncbi:hypothetical protein D3C85_1749310 [compost metagenome]
MMAFIETSGVQRVIISMARAEINSPDSNSQRLSTRPIKRPVRYMESMVPTPRGPMAMPAVSTG